MGTLTSPHSDTTADYPNDVTLSCGGAGNEKIYYADIGRGISIDIGQSTNDYDSRHQTAWGGDCPGTTVVACTDDPDTSRHSWINDQGSVQRVYFVIDAFSDGSGPFTIDWTIAAAT